MGGHSAVSLVVAIVLGLHSVAADCRVVGNVSDAPRISGNVSVAYAPGILLEGHSQGVLTSGHKSAKRTSTLETRWSVMTRWGMLEHVVLGRTANCCTCCKCRSSRKYIDDTA